MFWDTLYILGGSIGGTTPTTRNHSFYPAKNRVKSNEEFKPFVSFFHFMVTNLEFALVGFFYIIKCNPKNNFQSHMVEVENTPLVWESKYELVLKSINLLFANYEHFMVLNRKLIAVCVLYNINNYLQDNRTIWSKKYL